MCERTFHFWQEGRTYEQKNENISKDSICDGRIAFASIVLPLIFWNKIPEKSHNITMKWETWIFGRDKTSLILLFFVILFLLGMMSIVTYFVRTSGTSKNASESEKRTYGRLYPVIVLSELSFNVNVCLYGVLLGDMQSSWKMVPASVFDSDIFTFYLVYLQEPERDNTKKRAEKGIRKTGKGAGRRGGILSD